MKALFWLVAVFAAAVALALAGRVGDGYLLIVYPPWRVEVSLLLAILVFAGVFGAMYFGARIVGHTLALPDYVRAYHERRRRSRAQGALEAALLGYFEGRFARAEKEAAIAWESGAAPGLAALVAARAAHQMREFERRDLWLERAEATGEGMHTARLLTRAELALEERDFIGARGALRSLHGTGPRHIAAARMLLRAERGSHNWEEVLRLATLLDKRGALPPAVVEENRVQAHIELLAGDSGDRAALEARLKRIPAAELAHPRVATSAAKRAGALGEAALARELIERGLAADWNPALVALYGDIRGLEAARLQEEARARIERAEGWLPDHEADAQLLATLGRLCIAADLRGKARLYLEASLSFGESREAHLELARLAERDGRTSDAQKHFRRAGELP